MGLALYRGHQRRYIVAHPLPPFIPSAQGQTWKDILTDEARDISQKENIICLVYLARNCENFTRAGGAVWAILHSFTHSRIIIDKNLFSFILLCYIMWADPRSVIEMVASVTISGGYFPARSFHPIHFISLFLLPTLFTNISFTIICKKCSPWVKLFANWQNKMAWDIL